MIACNAVENGCLVYHTALEYYALHTQSFNWLYVHSDTPFRTFTHLNETYIYKPVSYQIKPNLDLANESYPIRVASLSQTIIDCIRHIDLAGGLEELMNALDWIKIGKLDEAEMIQCLDAVPSKSVFQRVGYLLSLHQEQLGLSDAFFEHCKNHISNNVSYLTPDEDCDTYDKKWKICVPKAIMGVKS
jgi:predicted transcriptional regulator of viral defense system